MGYGEYVPPSGPRLKRKVDFHIAGGVRLGPSNQVGAWLAQGLSKHLAKDSTFTMKAGGGDPMVLVSEGKADLCYSTMQGATAAYLGNSNRRPLKNLRAICTLPKRDWYQFTIPASLKVSSVEELIEKRCPIRLAVPPGPSPSGILEIAHLVFTGYGVEPKEIESWGGKLVIGNSSRPHEHVRKVLLGEADSVFEDGVATSHWWELFATREMKILSLKDEAIALVNRHLGNKATIIPRGWYHGKVPDREVRTIDASNWMVLVNEQMDDELAYLLTKCAVEYKAEFEAEFNMLPLERSSLTYPLFPSTMARDTGVIPLHPAAERYYREKNYL